MKRLFTISVLLLSVLTVVGADGCSSDPNVEGAKLDLRNKDYDRALHNLETALAANPTNAAALELKGRVLAEKAVATEDFTEHSRLVRDMIGAFEAAVGSDPTLDESVSRSLSIAFVNEFQRGIQAFNRGGQNSAEYGTAATYFGLSAEIRPDSTSPYVNQAVAFMNAGRGSEAIEPFRSALTKGDTDINTFLHLARLLQAGARTTEALEVLEQGSRLYPTNGDLQAELLNAYQASGQIEPALARYEALIEQEPDNRLYRFNYGTLLTQVERYDDAIAQLERAVEIDPEYASAQYNLGAAYVHKAVELNARISELDERLREKRDALTEAEVRSAMAEIDRLAEDRRQFFARSIPPFEKARTLLEANEEDTQAVCRALFQSFVQTNRLDEAAGVSACSGY